MLCEQPGFSARLRTCHSGSVWKYYQRQDFLSSFFHGGSMPIFWEAHCVCNCFQFSCCQGVCGWGGWLRTFRIHSSESLTLFCAEVMKYMSGADKTTAVHTHWTGLMVSIKYSQLHDSNLPNFLLYFFSFVLIPLDFSSFLPSLFDNITAPWAWLVHGYWALCKSTVIIISISITHPKHPFLENT